MRPFTTRDPITRYTDCGELPAGTPGYAIGNQTLLSLPDDERVALRKTRDHNRNNGNPGCLVMLAGRVRFLEYASINWLDEPRKEPS